MGSLVQCRPDAGTNMCTDGTFLWFVTSLAGITIRRDCLGVTSIDRALGPKGICYDRILDFYHGSGLKRGIIVLKE
jgi:hypothetical protein